MKMKQKNIVFYFSDQQRWDTVNETLTPNLMQLATEGVKFDRHYTCQPVCGPARACLQTGLYATQCGVCFNGISLPREIKGLAQYFNEAGYETAYIGKWHLASDRFYRHGVHCANSAIPRERQGGYQYFRGADVLEATSHGYEGLDPGKTSLQKIQGTKGTFHAKMGSIKDRNGMDLTEAEDIKKRW